MNKTPKKGLSVLIILTLIISMTVNAPLIFADDNANRLVNAGFEETKAAASGWDQLGAASWSVWKRPEVRLFQSLRMQATRVSMD